MTILAYDDENVGFEAPTGKKFVKWTTNADGTGDEYQPDDVIDDIADNYDLYAQWRDIVYHVSFSVNGVIVSERNVNYNTAIGTLPEDPELAPLTFLGWSSTSATGATNVTASWKPTGENENVTVYAVFGSEGNQATMTITSADMPTSYPSYNSDSVMIQSKCYFGLYNVGHFSSNNKIQFKKQENNHYSYIYNAGDLGTLDSIVINYSDTQYDLTVTVGTTIRPTGGTAITARQTTGTTRSFILTGGCYTHFIIQNESTNTFKINSIALHYRPTTTVTVNVVTDNTNMSDDIETTTCVVVKDGATLNFTGDNKGNANNLIIENGGQLITTSANVKATVKKNTSASTPATRDEAVNNWYAIASPVADLTIASFVPTAPEKWNVFRYIESTNYWNEYRDESTTNGCAPFTTFENGRGYLYRSTLANVEYAGTVNAADVSYSLTANCTNDKYKGFNLIGNPFTHDIYKNDVEKEGEYLPAINSDKLAVGYYRLETNGTWTSTIGYDNPIKSGEGVLVKATEGFDLTIANNNNPAAEYTPGSKSGNNDIMFTVANSQYKDVAYAMFSEGFGLNKIEHYNAEAQMLYINQNGTNFAIAMMGEETQSFNLNFEAKTFGKYTLSLKANGNFSYLHLIDRLTGEDVDMLLDGEYSFIASPTDNANRFIVRLEYSEGSESSETFAFQNGSDIIVNGEGELQIFDVMGRMIATQRINGVETVNVSMTGVYIFKLNEKTQKMVVR